MPVPVWHLAWPRPIVTAAANQCGATDNHVWFLLVKCFLAVALRSLGATSRRRLQPCMPFTGSTGSSFHLNGPVPAQPGTQRGWVRLETTTAGRNRRWLPNRFSSDLRSGSLRCGRAPAESGGQCGGCPLRRTLTKEVDGATLDNQSSNEEIHWRRSSWNRVAKPIWFFIMAISPFRVLHSPAHGAQECIFKFKDENLLPFRSSAFKCSEMVSPRL